MRFLLRTFFSVAFLIVTRAHAATISVNPATTDAQVGDSFVWLLLAAIGGLAFTPRSRVG